MSIAVQSLPLELIVAGVLAATLAFRTISRWMGQPLVVGEILSGLLIGLVLAAIPGASVRTVASSLALVGNFGLVFLVFGALLHEKDERAIDWRGDLTVSAFNVLPAFIGGGMWAVWYASAHAMQVSTAFILLVATATAISAVPVLARILAELHIGGTPVGRLSFRVACITDVVGWLLVGAALAIHSDGEPSVFAAGRGLLVLMLFGGLHALRRLMGARWAQAGATKAILVILLAVSGVTHMAGLHVVFGAFIVGTVFGTQREVVRDWKRDMGWVTDRFFCPLYFVVAGMNILSGSFEGAEFTWGLSFLVVSMASKLLPLYWVARRRGMSADEGRLLALLLNARGLMELVILGIGLQAGILNASQYALFVVVAVVTTVVCTPLCRVVLTRMRRTAPVASGKVE
ncbi:cation:proton antiporter [Uliginosibacterium sp. sgz301328]|uniref:cation:proton antiporter n=1 Tax=Uliginosibacterium sp. sgz301328 TaxID=3243764 RepID=UPI00359D8C76